MCVLAVGGQFAGIAEMLLLEWREDVLSAGARE